MGMFSGSCNKGCKTKSLLSFDKGWQQWLSLPDGHRFRLCHNSDLILESSTAGIFTSSFSVTCNSKVRLINLGVECLLLRNLKTVELVLIIYQTWHALLPESNVLPGLGSKHRKRFFYQLILWNSSLYFLIRACRKVRKSSSDNTDGHPLVSVTQKAVVLCNFFENQHHIYMCVWYNNEIKNYGTNLIYNN